MSVEETGGAQSPQQGGGLEAIGERLASARRERKLELGAVASQMHLSREVVAALEAGNASALPAMTFVRGYIKTYARLLGLDEKEVFALLPVTEGFRPAPLKAVGMRGPRRRQPIGKWLLWPIAAFLAFGVIAYGVPLVERLWNKATRVQQEEENPNVLHLPLGEEQGDAEQPAPEPDQGIEPLPEETAPSESAVTPESEFETGGEVAAAAAETPLEAPAKPEAAPVAETAGPAMITMRFSQDSWVEMESHGRKLVVGIQSAGSERSVRAEPPVQLLLGNAPGVELEYRGKPVDLTRYRRGKVARLVLED